MQRFNILMRVSKENWEMKQEPFCKYYKSSIACFYETGDEHCDLWQQGSMSPPEGLLNFLNNFYAIKVLIIGCFS